MVKLVVAEGCPTCDEIKSNGACKDNQCLEITDPKINSLMDDTVKFTPEQVCFNKTTGKYTRCGNINKIIRKYSKKKSKNKVGN